MENINYKDLDSQKLRDIRQQLENQRMNLIDDVTNQGLENLSDLDARINEIENVLISRGEDVFNDDGLIPPYIIAPAPASSSAASNAADIKPNTVLDEIQQREDRIKELQTTFPFKNDGTLDIDAAARNNEEILKLQEEISELKREQQSKIAPVSGLTSYTLGDLEPYLKHDLRHKKIRTGLLAVIAIALIGLTTIVGFNWQDIVTFANNISSEGLKVDANVDNKPGTTFDVNANVTGEIDANVTGEVDVNVNNPSATPSATNNNGGNGGGSTPQPANPTTNPTVQPTTNPTTQPTTNPTTQPTTNPTTQPTTNPSAAPSQTPTMEPTPTLPPVVSPSPSGEELDPVDQMEDPVTVTVLEGEVFILYDKNGNKVGGISNGGMHPELDGLMDVSYLPSVEVEYLSNGKIKITYDRAKYPTKSIKEWREENEQKGDFDLGDLEGILDEIDNGKGGKTP